MGLIFDTVFLDLALGAFLLFWFYYRYSKSRYSYWKNRSIAYAEPSFPFGTDKGSIFVTEPLGQRLQNVYMNFKKERVVGMFAFMKPYLIVRDPELLKKIMTKDFNYFVDRGLMDGDVLPPVLNHLFSMRGEEWKTMRHKLTPAFTSGKIKMMFFLMEACSEELIKSLEPIADRKEKLAIKDFIANFTTDVIASCAFGLQSNSIKNPDNEFRKNGKKFFELPPITEIIKHVIALHIPWLFKKFHLIHPFPKEVVLFFRNLVGDTVAYREKCGVTRNDFIDLLIKIKNNKSLYDDEINEDNINDQKQQNGVANGEAGLTLDQMTAQAILFFIAGFETSASALSFCLYEISLNPEIQTKMRKEIDEVLTVHNGKTNYQALQDMTYMDAVINETLRRYASLSLLNRECVQDYKVPDMDLVIPKGMKIFIPIYAIHHDPEYYPNPYKFDPERFTDDKIKTKNNYTFMPFGEGPRMCIGTRFAMMQMKICLSMLLQKFELAITEDTPIPLGIEKKQFFTIPDSPIILKISKRND